MMEGGIRKAEGGIRKAEVGIRKAEMGRRKNDGNHFMPVAGFYINEIRIRLFS
jgi:hypothetical protein